MTPQQFQETIRVINCMSGADFLVVFGNEYEHYLDKRRDLGLGEFICYLDNNNIKNMIAHVETKQEAYRQRKLAQ